MFEFDITDDLKKILKKLANKNPLIARAINRKIKEIINRDKESINIYKNLSYGLNNLKRVHITDWLVMTFEVDINKEFILFINVEHRDKVYKKKQ
ncbi:MAG: type II toxin-antitoxin system RelE/ParE family toxin [Nanoarchaeota archaeon]|nr:type II toxin-antitoxin system RelE/ParE family toxin [Nanoarchaeota archaeon]MBU1270019.1 type II toxin-antitoxin system RelE/ParE family toxin [Nanoarchaeota archaeon]MBU1604555.1 type II toxin-antitoxin system RelE/ParE family toxin [Nanoarchaeota archaeon]MBU2443623.1 type II toxin-antitoxin system RelE/ParE family toxin [Nanoarchaeota archaeon]